MRKFYLVFLLLISHLTFSQEKAYEDLSSKEITLKLTQDSLFLDSLSLIPGSLHLLLHHRKVDSSYYHYDYSSGYLHFSEAFRREVALQDTVVISYRVLPFGFHTPHFHQSLAMYDSNAFFNDIRYATYQQEPGLQKEELFASPGLMKSGSISRGIAVGNRQNIFVNADLNLQLEGALTKDINIRAAITDQNILIQPEGNTQQLQNFDHVLIELYNTYGSLTAGDVILQHPGNTVMGPVRNTDLTSSIPNDPQSLVPYFLRYQRNVQGGVIKINYPFGKKRKGETTAGIALAKGKFASMQLEVQEGIQGPYRLKAPGNQQYSNLSGVGAQNLHYAYYILANTEKVYLDGRLLQRGFDQDYTIDYNLGEIIFTTHVLLTRNSRVNVDFEYADRNYSRNILTAGHQQTWEKLTLYTHYFQEKDNLHQPLGFSLTDDEKWLLSQAGDQVTETYITSVDSVGMRDQQFTYQANQNADVPGVGNLYEILYAKKDTLVDDQLFQVYEFSETGNGIFKIDFSYVGEGKGSYRLGHSSVNGKVYAWTAPVNDQKQGDYEPVRLLATPKNKQLLAAGFKADMSPKDHVFGEAAISYHDLNTFSRLDAQDNQGSAMTVGYENTGRTIHFLPEYKWMSSLRYEYVQQHFATIDPYRSIEFERNWSVLPQITNAVTADPSATTDDHLLYMRLKVEKNMHNQLGYRWTGRNRPGALRGEQHEIAVKKAVGKVRVSSDWFYLKSQQPEVMAHWNRWNTDLHYNHPYVVPGYAFRLDKNYAKALNGDSVLYSLMNFEEHQVYLRSGDSLEHHTFRLDYVYQTNFTPFEGQLLKTDINHTVNAISDVRLNENQTLKVKLTYRHNDVLNDSVMHDKLGPVQENVVMGTVDWKASFFKNIIRSEWHYTVANGRELKREFVYIRVPVGEGSFTWRDDNGNGVEEIEEFYEARYWDERNYVRVYTTTNEYILAYTNQLDGRASIQFPSQWLQGTGFSAWIARFSNTTSWHIAKKVNDKQLRQRLNPLAATADEHLLYIKEHLRSTLFFNRQATRFGMDAGIRVHRRKQLLNGGFEERNTRSMTLNSRLNFNQIWGMQLAAESSLDNSLLDLHQISATGNGRNFYIQTYRVAPEIAWQPKMNLRVTGKYGFADKQNLRPIEEGKQAGESALIHTLGCDVRLSRLLSSTFNIAAEHISIDYYGDVKNPVSYEMLDALQPGHNVRWTLSWQQKLWDGLQLTANYEGRKSPLQSTIHTGNVIVRALF